MLSQLTEGSRTLLVGSFLNSSCHSGGNELNRMFFRVRSASSVFTFKRLVFPGSMSWYRNNVSNLLACSTTPALYSLETADLPEVQFKHSCALSQGADPTSLLTNLWTHLLNALVQLFGPKGAFILFLLGLSRSTFQKGWTGLKLLWSVGCASIVYELKKLKMYSILGVHIQTILAVIDVNHLLVGGVACN